MLSASNLPPTGPTINRHPTSIPQHDDEPRWRAYLAATPQLQGIPPGNEPVGYRLPQAPQPKKPSLPANPKRTRQQTRLQSHPCPNGYRDLVSVRPIGYRTRHKPFFIVTQRPQISG